MARFSVSLSDELAEWVDDRAAARGVSKAQVIREAVELAKESDAATGGDITVVQSGEVTERLDDLEARVTELEERGDQPAGTDAAEPIAAPIDGEPESSFQSASDETPAASNTLDADVSDAVAGAVEAVAERWDDAPERLERRKQAAAVVLQYAVDNEDAVGKSSEIVATARERYPVEGQNADTYYRKNIRPILKAHGAYSQAEHGYIVDDV